TSVTRWSIGRCCRAEFGVRRPVGALVFFFVVTSSRPSKKEAKYQSGAGPPHSKSRTALARPAMLRYRVPVIRSDTVSAICGYVGPADPSVLDLMLAAAASRGDKSDTASADGAGLGYRFWGGRPGKAQGVHRAGATLAAMSGSFAPPVAAPA